jgi:ppGpp synthetase/RelA/SpoT-type nucleotidyltranferase
MSEETDEQRIDKLVEYFKQKRGIIGGFLESLHAFITTAFAEPPASELVHSVKRRLKDPEHLRNKLGRKLVECREAGAPFDYTEDNLALKINDLGGYRLLHLHTQQVQHMHPILLSAFDAANFDMHEPPFAHVWDQESAAFFESIGIQTQFNPRLYSSVHYVLRARSRSSVVTCEVQVRTLADEIWGEIDHKINYPWPHNSLSCREQIKALARVASSCSRLVDSIVATHDEWVTAHASDR